MSDKIGRPRDPVKAAFEMGRTDAQRRNGNGMKVRYSNPEKDAAYQRGWNFERDRQERGKR